MIANESIGERKIEPGRSGLIGVKSDAVWIAQPGHVLRYFFEPVRGGIELIEDVDHATTVIGEAEHVSDEEPVVRTERHEPDSFKTLRGDVDLIAFGQV